MCYVFKPCEQNVGRHCGFRLCFTIVICHVLERAAKVEKKHLHVAGTNRSDWLGTFEKPSKESDDVMKVKHSRKATLYGSALIACGNKVPGDTGPESDPPPRPTEMVPMNWHSMDVKVYEEFMHSYAVEGIIDLTANDGVAALCAIRQRKPYFGVCFSEEHMKEMRHFVTKRIFAAFQKVGDKLYQPTMKKRSQDDEAEKPADPDGKGQQDEEPEQKKPRKGADTPDAKRSLLLSKLRAMDDDDMA